MRSNYKRLGDYIEPCNEKNTGNLIKELRGISNQKFFQKCKVFFLFIKCLTYFIRFSCLILLLVIIILSIIS